MNNETITVNDSIRIQQVYTSAFNIPTATPESDGTFKWDHTTLVIVEIEAGGKTGLGYTYSDASAAFMIDRTLKKKITGKNVFDVQSITNFLVGQTRNEGNCGIAMMAISAIDNALWDLKAKILEQPLCNILGKAKDKMLLYGSGGFTNYTDKQLQDQFIDWARQGIECLKMKIGREPEKDVARIEVARNAIGTNARLFVDANGAYTIKQAIDTATKFDEYDVSWFEEPVSSDNLKGLHFVREHIPSKINIAAGEYGYNLPYFKQMLSAKAVDVLQADAFLFALCTSIAFACGTCIAFIPHC